VGNGPSRCRNNLAAADPWASPRGSPSPPSGRRGACGDGEGPRHGQPGRQPVVRGVMGGGKVCVGSWPPGVPSITRISNVLFRLLCVANVLVSPREALGVCWVRAAPLYGHASDRGIENLSGCAALLLFSCFCHLLFPDFILRNSAVAE